MAYEFNQVIKLPSQGLLNPEIPEGELTQRCMMVQDQKFLSGSNHAPGQAIHQLIQRTTIAPESFDIMKLTIPDTLYLLFKLRILSYGKDYKFRTRCPECGKKIEVAIDLSELPVEFLNENYEEELVVVLPHSGDTVYTKLMTNEDMDEVSRELKRRRRRNPEDDSEYILKIVRSIEKVVLQSANKDGKKELTSSIEIERYISSLTNLDASTIIATRDSVRYGITPTVEYVCPECDEYIDVNVQFSYEFFRPNIGR